MNNTELMSLYIDELSQGRDVSIIYQDSSTDQTIITVPLNLVFFQIYNNLIHYNIPAGYTDDETKTTANYPVGILQTKASEHHFKIVYEVAPLKKQSNITVNYLLHDNLVNSNTTTGAVGDSFDASSAQNNIPAGYQFLKVSSGLTNQYTYQNQVMNIELTQDPTTSSIEIIYKDEDTGNILNSFSVSGKVGSPFQLSTYESQTPFNYQFDNTNSSITTFTPDSNVVVLNCKIETGTITINYSNNGNIISSTSVTGNVGSSFNVNSYTSNIPAGYNYVSDNSSQVPVFQSGNQTITINVAPMPAPQPTTISEPVEAVYSVSGSDSVITRWNNVSEPPNTTLTDAAWAAQQGETEITDASGNKFVVTTDSNAPEIQWGTGIEPDGVNMVFYEPLTNSNAANAASASASASASLSASAASVIASMKSNAEKPDSGYQPIGPATGATDVTFKFIDRGSTMIDPTFHLNWGSTTLHHIFVLMKGEYSHVNAGNGEFSAGGHRFQTYTIPENRKFNINANSSVYIIHVHKI